MRLAASLCAITALALLTACAPTENDPKRSLTYNPPDQTVEPGFSRNEGFRGRQTLRTNSVSNKFGRSRGTVRSRDFRRGRIRR